MRRGPAIILGGFAVVFIIIIVAAFAARGGDETPEQTSIYGIDLGAIETATFVEIEAIDISGVDTGGLDGDTPATPRGCREEEYVIVAGDTPSGVADAFDVTYIALLELNPEIGTSFIAGATIKIPCPPTPEPTETADAESTPGPDGETATPSSDGRTITYQVEPGDVAADIAIRFGVTLEELAAANDTTIDALASLQVGDTLKIPNQ